MGISEAGVKKHLDSLRRIYEATNRPQLVRRAFECGDLTETAAPKTYDALVQHTKPGATQMSATPGVPFVERVSHFTNSIGPDQTYRRIVWDARVVDHDECAATV